jgi:prophage regulatory protein
MAHTNERWPCDRIIRLPEVKEITGASETSIWRWERQAKFPKRIKIGARMVGWRLSEVNNWLDTRQPKDEGVG